jgi:hypothetical protein
MTGPREVVQTKPGAIFTMTQEPARAWLLGHVRTDAPGYREVTEAGVLRRAASGEHRFDAYVTAIGATWQTYGAVSFAGVPTFTDRAGWLLGFGEAGVAPNANQSSSFFVPPAGIPLVGATWEQVVDDADRRQVIDRHRRNQGYVWGDASLFRCKLVMHRYALEALQTGWCLRGKVTLGTASMLSTPISSIEPRGAITGYALGLDNVSWLDSIQGLARVELSIVIVDSIQGVGGRYGVRIA